VLVTGRTIPDLVRVFPALDRFDRVVAENGAVVLRPDTSEIVRLAPPADARFAATLRLCGVTPLTVGECIIATWEPHQDVALDTIKSLGRELQVIFNKGAVMVLPSGINKATGLTAALHELGLSPRNVVGIGDAENDHAFLALCECAVAVGDAVPALRESADWVLEAGAGQAVVALAERLVADDLASIEWRLHRHDVVLATTTAGTPIPLPSHGPSLLIAGMSGAGKSTFATGLIERLHERGAQIAIVDPEGDYATLEAATVRGDAEHAPDLDEIAKLVEDGEPIVVANLLGVVLERRPAAFAELLGRWLALRLRTGRPHWIVVDEAHHLVPRDADIRGPSVPPAIPSSLWITVHPDHVSATVLRGIERHVALGTEPNATLARVAGVLGVPAPAPIDEPLGRGEAALWMPPRPVLRVHAIPPQSERRRHVRKYAAGELDEDRSFWFRGPERKLNLRAPNLIQFLAIGDGVDDETWQHHRAANDYSRWIREEIKDAELAAEVEAVERNPQPIAEARAAIRAAIERRYTLPA
jgi:hypothetical protein